MTAASDFLEERMGNHVLVDDDFYVVPFHITVSSVSGVDYNVTVHSDTNGSNQFTFSASGGDTKAKILNELETKINNGSQPVRAIRYNNVNNEEVLMIEQDSSWNNVVVETSTGGSPNLPKIQRVFGALYLGDPTDTGNAAKEVIEASDSNGYERQPISFDPTTNPGGVSDNTSDVQFGPAGAGGWDDGGTEKIEYAALHDAPSRQSSYYSGNLDANDHMLIYGSLATPKDISNNDTLVIRSGDLDITVD